MNRITLTPKLDFVIVLPDAVEEKTAAGVYIPDTAKEKPLKGTVVAVGEGLFASHTGAFIPTTIKRGERVLHNKYGNTEVEHEGVTYLIMKESNIHATLQS